MISNEWNTGFTAEVRLTNVGDTLINGWSVNWTYSDGSAITSSWNATLGGTNPYTASNVSWNGNILPGQTVSFGMQGDKGSENAELPELQGDLCTR